MTDTPAASSVVALKPKAWKHLQGIREDKWKEIILKLNAHAKARLNRLSWRCTLPLGKDYEDIALEAISDIFTGKRNWDPEKHTNLLVHLKSIVDSKCNNLVKSAGHTTRAELISEGAQTADVIENTPSSEPSPAQILEAKVTREQIWQAVKNEPELEELLLYYEEEYKPAEIAKELGLPIKDIRNRIKRLNRRLDRIKNAVIGASPGDSDE